MGFAGETKVGISTLTPRNLFGGARSWRRCVLLRVFAQFRSALGAVLCPVPDRFAAFGTRVMPLSARCSQKHNNHQHPDNQYFVAFKESRQPAGNGQIGKHAQLRLRWILEERTADICHPARSSRDRNRRAVYANRPHSHRCREGEHETIKAERMVRRKRTPNCCTLLQPAVEGRADPKAERRTRLSFPFPCGNIDPGSAPGSKRTICPPQYSQGWRFSHAVPHL